MNIFSVLPEPLQQALRQQGITEPTPVQTRALQPILEGKDVLISAPTGTGKTLSFLLPLIIFLEKNPSQNALVLSPTRELAEQTAGEFLKLTQLPCALIIGGDNIHKQYAALRRKPRLIVGTPGRILDHIGRKSINLKQTSFLVLDETDRMLDMGFIDDMRQIVSVLPARQTVLLSATLAREVENIASGFLHAPVRVQIGSVKTPAEQIFQEVVFLDIREKLPQLLHELTTCNGAVLVFTKTKHGAERLTKELKRYGQKAAVLHGELGQNRRRQVLEFFKNQTVRVLVATDLAARGLDVAHIERVVNYDLPLSTEDYIHRIGRTGRAGDIGSAVTFVTEKEKWRELCQNTSFAREIKTVQKTINPLPVPKFVAEEESAVRKKKRTSSPYTKRAKELLQTNEVFLPQETKTAPIEKSAAKRPSVPEHKPFLTMRQQKAMQYDGPVQTKRNGSPQKKHVSKKTKSNFAKFFKTKKHR